MGPLMQLHVSLVTYKGLCQGHSGFKSLYCKFINVCEGFIWQISQLF